MRKVLKIFILLFVTFSAIAQDGTYSLFLQNPMYLNPSMIGTGPEAIRFGGIYRSQWQKTNAGYSNYGAFLDTKYKQVSFGLLFNQNKAGETGYQKSNALFALGFQKPLTKSGDKLSIGAQIGLNQISIDPNKLTFDNQYNSSIGFDETLISGESFKEGAMKMTDLNIGFSYHFYKNQSLPVSGEVGLAFYHANSPSMTSLTGSQMNFPIKTILHGRLDAKINEKINVETFSKLAFQSKAREFILGVNIGFNKSDSTGFHFGIANRFGDALLFNTQFKIKNLTLGIGFDYSISKMQEASPLTNAMELSMVYDIPLKAKSKTLKDLDEDGVIDQEDDCPEVPGLKSNHGCPEDIQQKKTKGSDYDKDGILDENDLCPYEFGEAKYQGCNDRDADGIWDHIDVCPSLPGKVENHGCPVVIPGIDSDMDGVPDRFDKCIYMKGEASLMGCPDTDGDGVSDLLDDCPYIKGEAINNGCPDNKSAGFDQEMNPLSSEVIEFETDRFNLPFKNKLILDQFVSLIKSNVSYKIIIEGHTDNEGSSTYNFQLSQKRAQAVQDYLLSKGLERNDMEVYYYGEKKPKVGNSSNYGKARNRRVEIILIDRNK